MGILFSKASGDAIPDLQVDLENARPSAEEAETYQYVAARLRACPAILQRLRNYAGCSEQIRLAISAPSPQHEDQAWQAVCPAVETLKLFYEFSLTLEDCLPKLLAPLTQGDDVHESLERQPALTKLFADILDFVFEFDELKMANAHIQNDFSYYRRTMNRMRMNSTGRPGSSRGVITDEVANRMSLFYAFHAPMMKTVTEVTTNYISHRQGNEVTDALAGVSGVCYHTLSKSRSNNQVPFLLRVMVATTIMYDHIHPQGAFIKGSPINIKSIVKVIQTQAEERSVQGLLNTLRYNSRHLNDETTPKSIRQLLAS